MLVFEIECPHCGARPYLDSQELFAGDWSDPQCGLLIFGEDSLPAVAADCPSCDAPLRVSLELTAEAARVAEASTQPCLPLPPRAYTTLCGAEFAPGERCVKYAGHPDDCVSASGARGVRGQ